MARASASSRARRSPATAAADATDPPREIALIAPPIIPATDLGNVQVLKHSTAFLLSDQFGDVHPDSRGLGLYQDDTRILSRLELRLNGRRPALLQGDTTGSHRGTIHLANPDESRTPGAEGEPVVGLTRTSFGVERERTIADGMRERVRVVNYAAHVETIEVELEVASDAADIFEVRGYPRAGRGELLPALVEAERITFRYAGRDGLTRTTWFAMPAGARVEPAPDGAALRLSWRWELAPGAGRELEWAAWSLLGSNASRGRPPAPGLDGEAGAAAHRAWASGTTRVETDHEVFNRVVARSLSDLRLLVNDGPAPGERYIAAGVPWFATLFGRDAIIASLELLAFRPQAAVETLRVLAARQARVADDWRDAEPGKLPHEWRSTEMVRSGEVPFGPYYGSVDATPLWLILLSETHRWTGDRGLLDELWPNAIAALAWIDRTAAADADGFIAYSRRSTGGLFNQGWKDSGDAIRRRDGSQGVPPIRLAEVQGYVYDARRRMAELARVRGDERLAGALEDAAEALRRAFEARFWMPDLGYYAMALDAEDRPADAIASNPAHCLWSGIVAPDRARAVAARLLGPELFTGWGVRTLATGQPGYNPIGYHTGTVWPHDTAIAAAGLRRYGFDDEANRLATSVLEAAEHFPGFRLPELFCGFDRATTGVPVAYPVACSPQAWAAGAPYLLLQSMLGLHAHADRQELELRRPDLPRWLSRVTLTNVRVGDGAVDLLFHRWRGTTSAEVLRKVGDISVTIRL
jgi:glycogen debranching enzyme